jgi:hypothetical protein
MNRGQAAVALAIATLEAELARAATLRDQYSSGELDATNVLPLRHFCAGLVEAAVELARTVSNLSAADTPVAGELVSRDEPDGQ